MSISSFSVVTISILDAHEGFTVIPWLWLTEHKDQLIALGSISNPIVLLIGTIIVNLFLFIQGRNAEKERGRQELLNSYLNQMTILLVEHDLSI